MDLFMDPDLAASASSTADQPQPAVAPRALKVAVIVMGVTLIVGFIAVFTTIGYRVANPRAPGASDAGGNGAFAVDVPIPAGSAVADLQFTGDRALILLEGPGASQSLVVLDTARGRAIGRFTLARE
jgi:hypothetical protein